MKPVYQLAVGLLVLFSIGCGSNKPTDDHRLTHVVDTFWLCDKLVEIDTIKQGEYEKVDVDGVDTSEAANILHDSVTVKRRGDSLILLTGSKEVVLVNNHSDNSDSTANYEYQGFNKDMGKYIVYGVFWEWYNYILIDKETGDTTVTCGEPVLSPDKKFFICGNADLIAQFTFNGFELYENLPKPKLICQKELTKWGPQEIKWIAQNTLLVEATVSDTTIQNLERPAYYRLSIK